MGLWWKGSRKYHFNSFYMAKVYYDRTMSPRVVNNIKSKYNWVIDYVKAHPELDFQTGRNNNTSWFSVYRGTSRVFSIKPSGKVEAAQAYMDLCPEFYKSPSPELFDVMLNKITNNPTFDRYYAKSDLSFKKEGYYQTLIGRRYSFEGKENDDFIIIDKEMVIGFENTTFKNAWNQPIKEEISHLIQKARNAFGKTKLPQDIHDSYGEFDFLALNWEGDIIIMELKQDDPNKTYLSPFQICYYKKQFEKLLQELPNLYDGIRCMIEEKLENKILNVLNYHALPKKLSGKVKYYLIVGEEESLSEEVCRRYHVIKDIALPELEAFTCDKEGTLTPSKKLF